MKLFGFPWTIRTRLSLLYAGAFFLAGVALIAFMYLFLGQVLEQQFIIRTGPGAPPLEASPDELSQGRRIVDVLIHRARADTLQTVLVASFVIVGVLTAVAALIGWLVAGHALRPLRDITATARRVADRSLHERIALSGPQDEIKDLADTLDAMLERLDSSFDSQRRFVANASHELRTPLTITRTLIEVALLDAASDERMRQLGTTLLTVNRRHEKLIDGLLTLATSEQRPGEFHLVNLAEIASHLLTEYAPISDKASIRVEARLEPALVMGDSVLLERLVQNLVENAIQYNLGEGGWVRVATEATGRHVALVVENTGPIVPAYEVPGLFEPFRRLVGTERLAAASGAPIARGAGLGLSIVRSIASAHDARVEATPRAGGGLALRVDFIAVPALEVLTGT